MPCESASVLLCATMSSYSPVGLALVGQPSKGLFALQSVLELGKHELSSASEQRTRRVAVVDSIPDLAGGQQRDKVVGQDGCLSSDSGSSLMISFSSVDMRCTLTFEVGKLEESPKEKMFSNLLCWSVP